MLIDIIAGARPNFMKIAAIAKALDKRIEKCSPLRYRIIHTGQHYDARMSEDFFTQLGIPQPAVNLEVGSGSQAEQTAAIMMRYERLLLASPSDVCLVVGDVTSTMACAITAQKLHVKVAHVEAGIRSFDWTMPEEVNRLVTDSITNWFFTTSEFANENLRRSGIDSSRIFFVGNTMIDTLLENVHRLKKPAFWEDEHLSPQSYLVMTLHRPANVDNVESMQSLLHAVCVEARGLKVVFPVHPRTSKKISDLEDKPENLILVEPQPYLEFNYLVKNAKAVITDSGGVTEETTVLGVPCMTLRENTERPETVSIGTNELLGTNPSVLPDAFEKLFSGGWKKGAIPELWDGSAGERIAEALERIATCS